MSLACGFKLHVYNDLAYTAVCVCVCTIYTCVISALDVKCIYTNVHVHIRIGINGARHTTMVYIYIAGQEAPNIACIYLYKYM